MGTGFKALHGLQGPNTFFSSGSPRHIRRWLFIFDYESFSFPTNTQPTRMPNATMSVTTSPAQNMKNSMNNHFLRSVPNAKIDGTHSPTKSPYCFATSGLPAHSAPRNQSPTLSKKLNPEATKMEPVKTLFIVSSFKNVVKNRESRQIIRSEQSISRVKRQASKTCR